MKRKIKGYGMLYINKNKMGKKGIRNLLALLPSKFWPSDLILSSKKSEQIELSNTLRLNHK